jgi:hypothetical protein
MRCRTLHPQEAKVRRNALLIAIMCVSFLLLALWSSHRGGCAGMGGTPAALLPDRQTAKERSPARAAQFPANDETGISPGKPSLVVAGSGAKRARISSDSQFLFVRQMLRDYRAALGENPVGSNKEITKALLGSNSRNARFLIAEAKVNSEQQLVDRWDHPYFFHQLSRKQIEIRSAGPDGRMWTGDDEISR